MTTPNGQYPDDTFGSDLSGLSGLDEASWRAGLNSRVIGSSGGGIGFNGLFRAILGSITGTVDNSYIYQLPIIQEQQDYITDLRDAVERMILQGQSIFYDGSTTHYISDGVVSIDFIILGGGGGGGGGGNYIGPGSRAGMGGAGGGETHFTVPRSILGDSVQIMIGAGGAGGNGLDSPGYGGTPSKIVTASGELASGGGQGGMSVSVSTTGVVSVGGTGMIQGGAGGINTAGGRNGGTSVSPYSLNGGGGGGGCGYWSGDTETVNAGQGGAGGISPGGLPGAAGTPADGLAATGGGGGGGGVSKGDGSAGGFPSGGGGGAGMGSLNSGATRGGNGAQGRVYVIERTA